MGFLSDLFFGAEKKTSRTSGFEDIFERSTAEKTLKRSETDIGISGKKGGTTSQLQLDPAGIDQIIQDVLGGAGGLAEIFGGEQNIGIFNSSVANLQAGDLAAKLVREIARITGKTVTTEDEIAADLSARSEESRETISEERELRGRSGGSITERSQDRKGLFELFE